MPERKASEEREQERRRQRQLAVAPWLLGLCGAVGSALLWRTLHRAEVGGARAVFELAAAQRIARVELERAAALEPLRSVAALFDSSNAVEVEEFRTFTASALERNDALRALLWIEPGPPTERVAFAEGPERASLASAVEFGALPEVRLILARAAASDALALTGPLRLTGVGSPRVLAVLSVRHHRGERVGDLHGHVGLLLDVERLLLRAGERAPHDVWLRVEDVTGPEPALLASSAGADSQVQAPELDTELDVELDGRRWRITAGAPAGFVARHTSAWPLLALLLGLVGTAAVVLSIHMATSRRRAQALVERRSGEILQSYATLASEAEERRHATREAKESQQQLRQILDLVPSQIYVKDRHGRMLMANQATADAYGTTVRALTRPAELDVDAEAGEPGAELSEDRALMLGDKSVILPARPFVDAEGRRRLLTLAKIPCQLQGGPALLYVGTDVTERRQAEDVAHGQSQLLGELARGAPPEEVLRHVLATAERLVPGLRCSVLLLGPDRRHLFHGLAPSLPEEYSRAVEGLEIGPLAGSCGAAAHLGQRFIVRDVQQHPNWAAYRELARSADIRACWSEPIRASDGEILGTFAMYYAEPRTPEPYEERFIESMAYLAGIAIERGRLGAAT